MCSSIVDIVVSVCAASDLKVWRRTAGFLLRNVSAKRYILVVPDGEVELFRRATPDCFEIASELHYVRDLRSKIALHLAGGPQEERVGWYLQQFIKMNALRQELPTGLGVIWDADTIPVRKLNFSDQEDRLAFFKGQERHEPYFDLIRQLLGITERMEFSFIAQCFPVRGEWLAAMFAEIEARFGRPWDEAIISLIDKQLFCGFSEYETMGTYFAARFATQIAPTSAPWFRAGGSYLGPVEAIPSFYLRMLARNYAHVTFERQDRTSWQRALWSALRTAVGLPLR